MNAGVAIDVIGFGAPTVEPKEPYFSTEKMVLAIEAAAKEKPYCLIVKNQAGQTICSDRLVFASIQRLDLVLEACEERHVVRLTGLPIKLSDETFEFKGTDGRFFKIFIPKVIPKE